MPYDNFYKGIRTPLQVQMKGVPQNVRITVKNFIQNTE